MRVFNAIQRSCSRTKLYLKHNSPTILTCVSAVGLLATTVMAVKATPKAIKLLDDASCEKGEKLSKTEVVITAAPVYIPTAVMGVSTIVCMFGANALNRKQQASLISAYTMLNTSYKEYKNKVKELYGYEANKEVVSEIAKDHYTNDECSGEKQLFYDEYSKRYFESTRERVLFAEYHFNRNYALRGYAPLNEFYEFLGVEKIDGGDAVGWSIDDAVESGYQWIDFEHELVELDDGLECYIITTPFLPTANFLRGWCE